MGAQLNWKTPMSLSKIKARSKFRHEYCEELINHCALGYTVASFAAVKRVSNHALNRWLSQYPEFAEAREVALQIRSMKFQTDMINASEGETRANPASFIFALKNCDPENFREKIEVDQNITVPIIIDTGIVNRILDKRNADFKSTDVIDAESKEVVPQIEDMTEEEIQEMF
jgi:hypothetical protein